MYRSQAGEKSSLATLRKHWYSFSVSRLTSALNCGVHSNHNLALRLLRLLLLPHLVHGGQELVDVLGDFQTLGGNVLVDGMLAHLPPCLPVPRLAGRHRNMGTQLDDARAGHDFHLDAYTYYGRQSVEEAKAAAVAAARRLLELGARGTR